MGRVRTLQARFARRRDGAQIAADIGRRQSEPAQSCDHHMCKILANAMALFEHFVERRRDDGRFRVVLKIAADPVHQVDRAGNNSACRRKACRRISGDRLLHRHQWARKHVTDRRGGAESFGLECEVADVLPCGTLRRAARGVAANGNPRS